jgi:hypothetical protein
MARLLISACELPQDKLVDLMLLVHTVVLERTQVTILMDPSGLPPGKRLAPDAQVWVER